MALLELSLDLNLLQRFIVGQTGVMQDCSSYDTAFKEMRYGQKQTHWIWYVFPQIKGLTADTVTEYYSVTLDEANAFLKRPIWGKG